MSRSRYSDHKLNIAIGGNNRGRVRNQEVTWAWMIALLTTVHWTEETYADFMRMPKHQQDQLKNEKGFWIGAYCEGGRRAKKAIRERSFVTFDIDYAPASLMALMELYATGISDLEWVCHSTRKHSTEKPRLRIAIPLLEAITANEYAKLSRIIASRLDPEMVLVDYVSFRPAQMMYKPTASYNADWWFHPNDGELLDGKAVLAAWGDREIPHSPQEKGKHESAAQAEDPTTKSGIIGAFCNVYDILRAMDELIPGTYGEQDESSSQPRFRYSGSESGAGGAVVYDGKWLYSHHGSDPCADQLVNSWDMVRIHMFGHLDGPEHEGLPPSQWPSQKAMNDYAYTLEEVVEELREAYAESFDAEHDVDEGEPPRKPSAGSAKRRSSQ